MIRAAAPADVNAIIALSLKVTLENYPQFLGEDAVKAFIATGAVAQYATDTLERTFVFELEGEIIGVATLNANEVEQMLVNTAYHRQGIGAQLLHHAEGLLFQQYNPLILKTFPNNESAIAFYQRNGWQIEHTFVDEESGAEMVRLQKSKP